MLMSTHTEEKIVHVINVVRIPARGVIQYHIWKWKWKMKNDGRMIKWENEKWKMEKWKMLTHTGEKIIHVINVIRWENENVNEKW